MSDPSTGGTETQTREQRLAAKLRENLKRRKVQARQMDGRKPPLPKEEPQG